MALSSSLTTLFVLIMGVAIVGGLAGLLYAVHLHLSELMVSQRAPMQWPPLPPLRADGYAATSLPPHFSGHCWFGRSGLSLCELTTYHAHCCVNDREKLAVIGRVLADTKACDFAHSAPGARSRCTLGECG